MLELFAYLLVAVVCIPFVFAFIMGFSVILTFALGCILVPYALISSMFGTNENN